jgi:hypothetical protein
MCCSLIHHQQLMTIMKKNSILVGCRYQYTYAQAVVGKASVVSCQEGQGERRGCACMTKSRTMPSTYSYASSQCLRSEIENFGTHSVKP